MAGREGNHPTRSPALAEAVALWQDRRFDEAMQKFDAAVRAAPNDFRTLIEASRALGHRYRIRQSIALLERAARLGSRQAEVQHAIGETYQMIRQPGKAEAHFRRACRLNAHPRSLLALAHLCERSHALDEAEELTARVLRLESSSPAGQLLQARIQRRRGDFDAAESSLTRLTAAAPSGSSELTEAYGELSVLLDATGQYDRAWDATLRCKQVQRLQEAPAWHAAQFVTNRFRQATEEVTSRHFARWSSRAPAESPARVAVLTGFPRSGTTLLEQVLDAHPAAVSVEETEVFSDEALLWLSNGLPPETPVLQMLDDQSPERLTAARERYLRAMESMVGAPLADRLLVDKNPALNLLIPALRRVFPEIKIIVALRDPRDVVVSCFLRRMPVNPVSVWYLTLERTAQRYLIDMTAWLKLREQIGDWVEVRYEQSVADLPTEAGRMLAAMELPWDDAVLAYRDRAETRPVFSPTYEAVAQPLYASSIGRWRHYERHLAPELDALMPIVKLLGYDA